MSGAESEDTGDEEEASTSQSALTPTEASPHDSQDRTHRKGWVLESPSESWSF